METPTFWEKVLRNKKRKRFRLFAFLNCDWFDFCGKVSFEMIGSRMALSDLCNGTRSKEKNAICNLSRQ